MLGYGVQGVRVWRETAMPPIVERRTMKKFTAFALVLLLVLSLVTFVACDPETPETPDAPKVVRISTTTSVNDSGLMAYLQPYFEAQTGYKWEISSAGTGAAIESAKRGNADVILVHSKSQEEAFVSAGFGRTVEGYDAERVSFMYNYFVLVGPTADPAGASDAEGVKAAFSAIAAGEHTFISRGDKSGTHNAELKLWDASLGLTNDKSSATYDWYVSAGQGMGACLTMADEIGGYCLTDKATFLSYKNHADGDKLPGLSILFEQDDAMKNTYSMIAVNPDAPFVSVKDEPLPAGTVTINTTAADVFINWMNSETARTLIAQYGMEQYGAPLFTVIE